MSFIRVDKIKNGLTEKKNANKKLTFSLFFLLLDNEQTNKQKNSRGDSLLDYVEQRARERGIDRLLLLTTVTADWFVQRDFSAAGLAADCRLLPPERRAKIDASRGSKIFVKSIVPLEGSRAAPAGKRIGF